MKEIILFKRKYIILVSFLFTLFILLFLISGGNKILKDIVSLFFQIEEGKVLAEGYGYVDDPDPEDPEPEPEPDPEEEPEPPVPNGFWPDVDKKIIIEFQTYCYSAGEGQILFYWTGLDPLKSYTFQIWKGEELVLSREGLTSSSTLVYVKENPVYGYGISEEIAFGESYSPRVKNEGDQDWVYYDESIDNVCILAGGITQPTTFENKGDCNPDGFNLDENFLTFTTVTHPFPYVRYSHVPEKLDIGEETTFTFDGWCYEVDCSYYKWSFENANPSLVEGSTVATTTFIEEKRTKISLTVEDEDDYGCLYQREKRVGIIFAPSWREISPWRD